MDAERSTAFCRHGPLNRLGHVWTIGIHGRHPQLPVFRGFLTAIGDRNAGYIRTIIVLSSRGYHHLWRGIGDLWARQLQRCQGLKEIHISMARSWWCGLRHRADCWETPALSAWKAKVPTLERVDIVDQGGSVPTPWLGRENFVDVILKKEGLLGT